MTSSAPNRYNNYRALSTTRLTSDVWNQTVGDLAQRMVLVEGKATGYDDLVKQGVGAAITRINNSLAPAVDQIAALIQQANAYLVQLQQTAGGIKATIVATDADHRFITDGQLKAFTRGSSASRAHYLATA